MNHPITKGLMIVLLLFICHDISFGQSHLFCGTNHDDISHQGFESKAEFQKYLKFEQKFLANYQNKSANVDTVYLHHQIVRLDANTPAESLEDIDAGMAYMNERFINSNVIFVTGELSYIDDESMYEFVEEDDGDKTQERLTPGFVDVFYANTVEIRGSKVGGFAGGSRMVVSSGSGPLLTHEMGHIFGLAHTHGRYGSEPPDYGEDVNGFPHQVYIEGAVRYYNESRDDNDNGIYDCYETGDSVCDTPAEYVLSRDVRCFVSGEKEYNGNHRDYFGDLFVPELGNEMSYGCNGTLTPGQYARMRFIFENNLLYLQCPKCRSCENDLVVNKSENFGKNSFAWAAQCADIMAPEVMKNIVFDVPGNEINLEGRSFNVLENSNYTFSSREGKTIIDGSAIENNTAIGFQIKGDNLHFKDIHFRSLDRALSFDYEHKNVSITNCVFEDMEWSVIVDVVDDFTYSGNEVIGCRNDGLRVANANNAKFLNNTIQETGGRGVVVSACDNCEVTGNNIASTGRDGLQFSDCEGCTFNDNDLRDIENGRGMQFSGDLNNNITISDNILHNTNGGILFSTTKVDRLKILGNTITESLGSGISLNNVDRTEISNNVISDFVETGVAIRGGRDVLISFNKISDGAKSGTYFSRIRNIELYNNTVEGNGGYGFNLDDCEDAVIGGDGLSNSISSNLRDGIYLLRTQNFNILQNSIFCNEGNAIGEFNNDRDYLETPVIVSTSGGLISGTGISGMLVEVFGNKNSCVDCELENFVGSSIVDQDGNWTVSNEEYPFEFGESISATMHSQTQSSRASSCAAVEVQVGCFSGQDQLPFAIDFENQEFSEFRVIGKDFYNLDRPRCQKNDDHVLAFNARSPQSSSNIIYSNSFDLTYADEAILNFEIAHKGSYSNRETFLDISVSTDCGSTFESLFYKTTYTGLATESSNGDFEVDWIPSSCDAWDEESVDLSKYVGQNVLFRIEAGALEFWGQNLYLDNFQFEVVESDRCTSRPEIADLPNNITACEGEAITISTGNNIEPHIWSFNGEVLEFTRSDLDINQTGVYNVVITGEEECTSEKTISVEINTLPIAELSGATSICEGKSSLIDLFTDAPIIDWYLNDDFVIDGLLAFDADKTGKYTAVVTSEDGCTNEQSINVEVLENPEIQLSVDGELCDGSSSILSAQSDVTDLTWFLNQNQLEFSGPEYSATDGGQYTVVAVNQNGCSSEAKLDISLRDQPILDLILPDPVCEGESSEIFVASDASSVEWRQGGEVISTSDSSIEVLSSGTYEVNVTSEFGCLNQQEFIIENLDTPTVSFSSADPICEGESTTLVVTTDASTLEWFLNDVQLDGVTANELLVSEGGTYEVSASNDNGCSASDKTVVEVGALPTLELSIPDPVCEGRPSQVSITTDGSINEWVNNNEVINSSSNEITVKISGDYTVSVRSDEGCLNEMMFSIDNFGLPSVSLSMLDEICEGDTTSLTATTDASISEWRLGDELISDGPEQEIQVSEAGTYVVVVTDENGCESFANSVLRFMECSTPTIEIEDTDLIQLFPNPAQEVLNIEVSERLPVGATFKIFNNVGSLIKYGSLNMGANQVDLTNFVSGIYSVIIEEAQDIYTSRLIIMD